jgi:hypothetical protein
MMCSQRRWDTFIGWPIDKTCAQGRPSDFPRPTTFTSQCESVSGEMSTLRQKTEFVLWYAKLKSVATVQRKWRKLHPGEKAPGGKTLNRWLNAFKETEVSGNRNLQDQEHRKRMGSALDSPVYEAPKCQSLVGI